jgi:hypothetical protein
VGARRQEAGVRGSLGQACRRSRFETTNLDVAASCDVNVPVTKLAGQLRDRGPLSPGDVPARQPDPRHVTIARRMERQYAGTRIGS